MAARGANGAAGDAGVLTLEGVDVSLGGREILRDVSFTIEPGELTGLIGPNGAGNEWRS